MTDLQSRFIYPAQPMQQRHKPSHHSMLCALATGTHAYGNIYNILVQSCFIGFCWAFRFLKAFVVFSTDS